MKINSKDILKRYAIATLGLIFIAIGVALSLKSNLGTAPVSCPPAVLNLRWTRITVGTFTWMMHLVMILLQVILLGKKFELRFLMQIPAAFVFGYLCDAAIWLIAPLQIPGYGMKMVFCLLTVLVTAIGIRIEIIANAWMLAGDKTTAVLSDVTRIPFSTVKILFDIFLVALSAAFSWACFKDPTGNGNQVIIREGTLILAILTGLCMKLTDPLIDRLFVNHAGLN